MNIFCKSIANKTMYKVINIKPALNNGRDTTSGSQTVKEILNQYNNIIVKVDTTDLNKHQLNRLRFVFFLFNCINNIQSLFLESTILTPLIKKCISLQDDNVFKFLLNGIQPFYFKSEYTEYLRKNNSHSFLIKKNRSFDDVCRLYKS